MPDLTTRDLLRTDGVSGLLVTALTGFGGFALLLSALPLWAARGGAGDATAGLVTTTATLVATVATQFAVPELLARVGIGPALAAGLVALGAPAPLYALSTDPAALAAVSAVRGVGFGLLTVIGSLLVALLAPKGAYGRTAGLYGAAIALPNLLAVPGGVLLAERFSFELVLWLGVLPVLGVPAALRYGDLGRRAAGSTARPFDPAAARGATAPALVLVAATLAGGGLLTFVPIALTGAGALAAVALFAFGATAAVARWAVGGLADRRGPGGLLVPVVLLTASGVLVTAAGLAGAADSPAAASPAAAVLVLAGSALTGVGYGAVQNLTLLLAFRRAGPDGSATASTVWNAGFDTGTAVGAAAVGGVAGLGAGLPGAVALTAVPLLAVLPLTRRRDPGP
ncbi:MFS transporter [Quadrisphaera sp. GCM10027208]|uniref:MFS transporter n=1 Tax=Quadrisphaera sp. GCM10027208 TaxID=3273423 RepID=UPI003619681B